MGLAGMDVIFKLVTSQKLDSITLFPALRQFQALRTLPSHGSGWDRRDLQTSNFT